jgi:type II secretory pathway component PulK
LTRRPGYALIAVLIVIVVLSLAAYRFADSMTAKHTVAVRASQAAQAKAFATSGVYFAAGALADPDTLAGQLGGYPYDNPSTFSNVTLAGTTELGGGRFSLMSVGDTFNGSGEGRYQVRAGPTDEAAKLNINTLIQQDPTGEVLFNALMMLPNMTEDVADAIVDWADSDDTERATGAESGYYSGMPQPYLPKSGPLASLDELLLVRGVTPQLLYGNDRNRNGRLDPGEEDGNDFNRGWSEFLTVYGRELDVDATGNPRTNITDTSDLNTLSQALTAALGQEMSDYILASLLYGTASTAPATGQSGASGGSGSGGMTTGGSSGSSGSGSSGGNSGSGGGGSSSRSSQGQSSSSQSASSGYLLLPNNSGGGSSGGGSSSPTVVGTADQLRAAVQQSLSNGDQPKGKISSVMGLYNTQVTLPKPQNQQAAPTVVVNSPLNDPTKMATLLPLLLDLTTTSTNPELPPRVNVNTAPPEVLAALPGLQPTDVDAILAARGSQDPADPATTTGAWLVTQANLPAATFQNLQKYVTGRTMTYRVQSVGYFGTGGPVARVEAVIDTNQGHPRIVYFRDLTELGNGFDLPR